MPVLSYIHQLFSAETCQAHLHTLRWKEPPFQCPHCQSPKIGPWGSYHYRMLSATLYDGQKRPVAVGGTSQTERS